MGKTKILKSSTTTSKSGKVPEKKSEKSSKKAADLKIKRKRIFSHAAGNNDDPSKKMKKLVANVKLSKDTASSNWKAFLSAGLAGSAKPPRSNPSFKGREPNSKTEKRKADLTSKSSKNDLPTPTLNLEDSYICDLEPKSDNNKKEITKCVAMDCEMVGVYDGRESVLARVSLVNQHGECVYDKFVKPKEEVADYRTKVSGVRPEDLKCGEEFEVVQKEVAAITHGKILVGHALQNDLKVLHLSHPPKMIRDTSRFKPFRRVVNGRTPSLKKLTAEILGVTIQSGEHNSVVDAKATMQLYNLYQKEWENFKTQKKILRRKNAVAAALGLPKAETVKEKGKQKTEFTKISKNMLLDEFAAF